VDEDGVFLLRNPAVRDLLGGVTSTTGQVGQDDYHGLYHPDGRPMTDDELPYRRVFAGDDVPPSDILVRNTGVPGGRVINLVAKMLPDSLHGVRHAVVAFHDVTADRRHRDELANFAGVVAHDLLNPLATVDGWSELLEQDLSAEHPAAAAVPPIRRAAMRMRSLINDLLAYTTSRDANLSLATLDLDHLVTEIGTVRIDQAQSTGMPVPAFHTRDLGPVEGDPVLVRQLLDNLISNAIKYTAAGVTPAISVRSAPDSTEPGLVRIEIVDNGIGIPAGEHDAVFGNFHRAHRADGYAGTGLGLAICRRIVERHGGTIAATDNPAGPGTRIIFTLPQVDRGAPAAPQDTPAAATGR
ncbi:MAG TPA: HAMP domain-containing sensor histidine kinase, partial [Actinoplanes sp.]